MGFSLASTPLQYGADPNLRDRNMKTPLHHTSHQAQMIQLLLGARADVKLRDMFERTALHETFIHHASNLHPPNSEFARLLLAVGSDVNAQGLIHRATTSLWFVVNRSLFTESISFLLQNKANVNIGGCHGTTLQYSVRFGVVDVISALLDNDADPNCPSQEGESRVPLVLAMDNPQPT